MHHPAADLFAPSSSGYSLAVTNKPTPRQRTKVSNDQLQTIKSILCHLFDECNTPYHTDPYDTKLHDLCLADAFRKGYPIGKGRDQVDPDRYLRCGVIIASGAYGHLERRFQVFIALYTAFATWIDDAYSDDLRGIDEFYDRFLMGQRQHSEGLNAMASIIRETTTLYNAGSAQGSIIIMATLRFISGTMLEYEGKHVKMCSSSRSFSTYLRSFTGIAEAYAMFIFPPGMPIRQFMQAIPDLCHYINHYNDVLSFYKEERAGEINNFITIEAAVMDEDKIITLERLAREVGLCSQRVVKILGDDEAIRAFEGFKRGYLTFHTSLEQRYLLRDLFA